MKITGDFGNRNDDCYYWWRHTAAVFGASSLTVQSNPMLVFIVIMAVIMVALAAPVKHWISYNGYFLLYEEPSFCSQQEYRLDVNA